MFKRVERACFAEQGIKEQLAVGIHNPILRAMGIHGRLLCLSPCDVGDKDCLSACNQWLRSHAGLTAADTCRGM